MGDRSLYEYSYKLFLRDGELYVFSNYQGNVEIRPKITVLAGEWLQIGCFRVTAEAWAELRRRVGSSLSPSIKESMVIQKGD